jgi:hypothetical protein
MHVASTDATCRYADQYFIGARLRLREIDEFELQILFQKEGFHGDSVECRVRSRKFRLYNCDESEDGGFKLDDR